MYYYKIKVSYIIDNEEPVAKARISVYYNNISLPSKILLNKINCIRYQELSTCWRKLKEKYKIDEDIKEILREAAEYVKYLYDLKYLPYNCGITNNFNIEYLK